MSAVKVRAQLRKEWDSVNWGGDIWEDNEESGNNELLHSDEHILPEELSLLVMVVSPLLPPSVALTFSPPMEGINPALSVETPMTFHDSVVEHENADTSQDPSSPPTSALSIIRSKSKQASKSDVHSDL